MSKSTLRDFCNQTANKLKGTLGKQTAAFAEALVAQLQNNPDNLKHAQAAPAVFQTTMQALAAEGLIPGAEAVITSYRSEKKGVVFGYQRTYVGLLSVLNRRGVSYSGPELVYEGDTLVNQSGVEGGKRVDRLTFTPNYDGERGELKGGVFFWGNPDGSWSGRFVPKAAFDEAMGASRGAFDKRGNPNPNSPWATHYEAMCLKTVVLRCMKWLPGMGLNKPAPSDEEVVFVEDTPPADDKDLPPTDDTQAAAAQEQPPAGDDDPAQAPAQTEAKKPAERKKPAKAEASEEVSTPRNAPPAGDGKKLDDDIFGE